MNNMTKKEAQKLIEQAGGMWDDFERWMSGQTVGVNDDMSIDYYDHDVRRFIDGGCTVRTEIYD